MLILACGTSYYSGLIGEVLAGVARAAAHAGRDRERVPLPRQRAGPERAGGGGFAVGRDRRHARRAASTRESLGQKRTLAICNVATSAMVRETRLKFLTHAGVEIGVASTKAFTTQLAALFLLALALAKLRRRLLDEATKPKHLQRLRHLPKALAAALALEPQVDRLGRALRARRSTRCSSGAGCTIRSRSKAR